MKALLIAFLLALPSYASAQVLATIPIMADGNHDAHGYPFGPTLVPATASFLRVVFDTRDVLRGAQTLSVVIERSFNGGLTYEPAGNEVFSATLQPADFTIVLPQVGNQARVLRGHIALYDGRWRGKAFIELE